MRAYVVVILSVLSWLSGVLCYQGHKPAPLWGGALKSEEGGSWELCHSNFLVKSTFFKTPDCSFNEAADL